MKEGQSSRERVCACVVIQRVMRQAVSQHTHTVESRAVARDNIQV